MKHLTGTGNLAVRARSVKSSSTISVADSVFIERIKSRVKTWRTACKDSKGSNEGLTNLLYEGIFQLSLFIYFLLFSLS